jgi:hypothetical protein
MENVNRFVKWNLIKFWFKETNWSIYD